MKKEKYWLFCENKRLVSYDYKEEKTFENVLNDILQYFNFKELEVIRENQIEMVFKASFNNIESKYKILKYAL